jgi:WD40 repeat protein
MCQANLAWQAGQFDRVIRLLDGFRPRRNGDEDLRGFEWYYLWQKCHGDRLTLRGHSDWISSVAYSPDGRLLATASADRMVIVWDAATGQQMRVLRGHTCGLRGIAFSPDGRWLVSAGGTAPGEVKVWEVATGREDRTWQTASGIAAVAYSPKGDRLMLAGSDGVVRVWDSTSGRELFACKGHARSLTDVVVSGDGRYIASADGESVKLWRTIDGREVHTLRTRARIVAFSPDGKNLVSADDPPHGSQREGFITFWDVESGQVDFGYLARTGLVHRIAFSPDGNFLAAAGEGGIVDVHDLVHDRHLVTLHGHQAVIYGLAFGPDNRSLVSAGGALFGPGQEGEVRLWNIGPAPEPLTLPSLGDNPIALSPAGEQVASMSRDGKLTFWDTRSGRVLRRLAVPPRVRTPSDVMYSPDGRWLTTSGHVWDMAMSETIYSAIEGNFILRAAFSSDSRFLALACGENVRVCDIPARQEVRRFTAAPPHELYAVALSPDGTTVAAGGEKREVRS